VDGSLRRVIQSGYWGGYWAATGANTPPQRVTYVT